MTFLEKETNLIKKLQETNYEPFQNDKEAALDFLQNRLESFSAYMGIILLHQTEQRETMREAVGRSIEDLNRLSEELGLEPFAEVDVRDPQAVDCLIGQFMEEIFRAGITKR